MTMMIMITISRKTTTINTPPATVMMTDLKKEKITAQTKRTTAPIAMRQTENWTTMKTTQIQ
jgi:hypothetical protein